MSNNNYYPWFTLAEQYLKTSKLIMEQIKLHKNKWFMIQDTPIEWNDYFEATKWSDFNTFVPSLFLLQHGIELLLKGLIVWTGRPNEITHKVTNMLNELKADGRISKDLIDLFEYYVGSNPKSTLIQEFVKLNKHLNINNLHVDIRYPESRSGNPTDFSPFRYKEKQLLSEIETIISDIDKIVTLTIATVR